jgi:hypothetical protein
MPEYLTFDIETDPDLLAQDAFAYLADRIPGWVPGDGNLDTWIIEACARMAAEVRDVAANVPTAIFRFFGQSVVGIPARDATPATADSTWQMRDASGWTIPAGTLVGLRDAGGELVAFETGDDVVVPAGEAVTSTGAIPLTAVVAGAAASGLAGPVELLDALEYVDTVALTGTTSGGSDAEADVDYLDRLTSELRLLSPRPILARDFAVLAQRIAGVGRAVALDGYNPADETFDNERTLAVVVADLAGEPVSTAIRNQVHALLQAEREVNFAVTVIDPTYTTIAVAFTATAYPGVDPVDVEARAVQAVRDYLSPASWGTPDTGERDREGWINDKVVRYLEVAEQIGRVEGLHWIGDLTVDGAKIDVTLGGAAPLPRPGAVIGTVVLP